MEALGCGSKENRKHGSWGKTISVGVNVCKTPYMVVAKDGKKRSKKVEKI